MAFKVTYRGADGAVHEEYVEAAGREECVAECRRRGITPIRVQEGVKGLKVKPAAARDSRASRNSKAPGGGSRRRQFLAVLGILAVIGILGGGALWLFGGGREAPVLPPEKTVPAKVKDVEPAKVDRAKSDKPAEKPVSKPAGKPVEKPASKLPPGSPPPGTVLSVRTNDNDLVISEVVMPDGRVKLVTTELHPPVFSNPADQLIAAAMNASMTGQMAPLPLGPEADLYFKEAMKKPILDNPDDSEEVKRMKQVVRDTRREIAALMAEGQSFAEILEQHRELWNENVKIREGVVAEYRKIVMSGDEEAAKKYFDTMNNALGQMGIPPLSENDAHPQKRRTRKAKQ